MDHATSAHREEPGAGGAPDAPHARQGGGGDVSPLDRSLGGDLPCVMCGYSLRGLSIRSACPECATPVRATILAVVDPLASELQPIRHPRLIAAGLITWSAAALGAALLAWVPQLLELLATATGGRPHHPDLSYPIVGLILLSGVGAASLIAPHRGLGVFRIAAAVVAVLAYIPLAWVMHELSGAATSGAITSLLRGFVAEPRVVYLRLAADALVIAIVLGLRFNARVLVARSLVLRQGRVDRQTLAAVAVAAAVAASGDVIGLIFATPTGTIGAVPALIATGLLATGTALLTIGLAGAVIDSFRITSALRIPSPTLRDLLAPRAGRRDEAGRAPLTVGEAGAAKEPGGPGGGSGGSGGGGGSGGAVRA